MENNKRCGYKIKCLDDEYVCDGIACLRKRIFAEGLPQVSSEILNIDIAITRASAKVIGNCKPSPGTVVQ